MPAFPCMRCHYPIGEAAADSSTPVICPECGLEQTEAQTRTRSRQWTIPKSSIGAGLAAVAAILLIGALDSPPAATLAVPIAVLVGALLTTGLGVRARARHLVAMEAASHRIGYAVTVFFASALVYAIPAALFGLVYLVIIVRMGY